MNVVIIGTGNVASILGKKIAHAGHHIVQIFGRNAARASQLAYELNTESTNYWSIIRKDADIYLIAVADEAISDVAAHVKFPDKIVAHTAASVNKDVLSGMTSHYGVFYPLQSLRAETRDLPQVPIFIDANDDVARKKLEELARSISSSHVGVADDEHRLKMHVAAVVVSNFTNHLYALAETFCKKEGIDFTELIPLVLETAQRIQNTPPDQSQTGPASRRDAPTIAKHLSLLKDYPQLKEIYEVMTKSIEQGSTR